MCGAVGARRFTVEWARVTDNNRNVKKGQQGLIPAALFGACPKCGARTMFDGVIQFAPRCTACGLDYSRYNVGDGPAAFLTLIIGALIVIMALIVEFQFEPPLWVHALLWVPVTAGLTIISLRAAKAALLIIEHNREAHEGQIDPPGQDAE